MAGMDYISCEKCGVRLVYDGEFSVRENLEYLEIKYLVCSKCVEKLEKKLKTLEKHDRRKH